MSLYYDESPPGKDAYAALFETTGWNVKFKARPEELERAVRNSFYTLSAYDVGRLIGFGRVMSDGVLHAMIYDIIVDPAFQGRGVGTEILKRLVSRCKDSGIRQIQLFAAVGKAAFYLNRGFSHRAEGAPGLEMNLF